MLKILIFLVSITLADNDFVFDLINQIKSTCHCPDGRRGLYVDRDGKIIDKIDINLNLNIECNCEDEFIIPTTRPNLRPTSLPSKRPSISTPTANPTSSPSVSTPTVSPSTSPTVTPTSSPSVSTPTVSPTSISLPVTNSTSGR